MRVCYWGKDGGKDSTVWGFWLFEFKRLASIVLLKFEPGSRDAYHTHAFDCVSWVLRGELREFICGDGDGGFFLYRPSWRPIITRRDTFHKVVSTGTTWVLSFRGPWAPRWYEFLPSQQRLVELASGRQVVRHD